MLTSVYALIALGLNFIYGILRIVQFAHGQLYMMGAFMVWLMCEGYGLHFGPSLAIAAAMVGGASLVMERVFYRPLKGEAMSSLLMGIGLLLLLEGVFRLIFGGREHYIGRPLIGAVSFFGIEVPQVRILILGVSVALIILLFWFLGRTKMGRAMRAMAQDTDAASLQGINVNQVRPLGFAIASMLAALAGGLMLTISYVSPFIGTPMVIKGLLIIIIGGLGSLTGALAGAAALGLIDSLALTFIGPFAALLGYLAVVIILIVRPRGIIGTSY